MSQYDPEAEGLVLSDTEQKVEEPPMYKVFIHNDDYTTMEFVVEILVHVFNKSADEAMITMIKVHREGVGLCGVYTYEVAETKVHTVHTVARQEGFPLKCSMEKD
ncbi:MAG: ATP-dependent Clp protease adapter ClpS [Thermodesulfobacteriota bacterium]|nr:ATP-dependent Clp protease adapter ClpS [Thermodesulfobacteriota bacterium]